MSNDTTPTLPMSQRPVWEQLRAIAQHLDRSYKTVLREAAEQLENHTPTWDAYHSLSRANEFKRDKIKELLTEIAGLAEGVQMQMDRAAQAEQREEMLQLDLQRANYNYALMMKQRDETRDAAAEMERNYTALRGRAVDFAKQFI